MLILIIGTLIAFFLVQIKGGVQSAAIKNDQKNQRE